VVTFGSTKQQNALLFSWVVVVVVVGGGWVVWPVQIIITCGPSEKDDWLINFYQ